MSPWRTDPPCGRKVAYRRLRRILGGAVADALETHPESLSRVGRRGASPAGHLSRFLPWPKP